MTRPGADSAERRARRFVRLYPPGWRARYGEEFVQYLIDDLTERPFSPTRTADVLRGGLLARVAGARLSDDAIDPDRQRRIELAPRLLAFEAWMGLMAAGLMTVFLAGAVSWVISGAPGPDRLFQGVPE